MAKYMEQKPHNYGNPIHEIYLKLAIIPLFIITVVIICGVVNSNNTRTLEQCRAESLICFELINQDRISNGLEPLIWDNDIEKRALAWSQYMLDNDYYQHSGGNGEYAECLMTSGVANGKYYYEAWRDSPLHHTAISGSTADIIHYGAVGIVSRTDKLWFFPYNTESYATFQAY